MFLCPRQLWDFSFSCYFKCSSRRERFRRLCCTLGMFGDHEQTELSWLWCLAVLMLHHRPGFNSALTTITSEDYEYMTQWIKLNKLAVKLKPFFCDLLFIIHEVKNILWKCNLYILNIDRVRSRQRLKLMVGIKLWCLFSHNSIFETLAWISQRGSHIYD